MATSRSNKLSKIDAQLSGPILSLDLGLKRIGVAVSDPTLIAISRLQPLRRSNWKRLLVDVRDLVRRFDAQALVIGWPLRLDGIEGEAAGKAREIARKFARSLALPVFLQDERLTSAEAEEQLRAAACSPREIAARRDSESAAIILRDFISGGPERICVSRSQSTSSSKVSTGQGS